MILGKYTTVQAIRNILVKEMGYLIAPNRFVIANQEYTFPTDQNAWVIINESMSKVYSNQNHTFTDKSGNYNELQVVLTQDVITVNIMSKNLQALQFKEGIPMALRSIYAQQQQEQYAFKIAQIMTVMNLSDVEGGSEYWRFGWTLNVLSMYERIKSQTYFDGVLTELSVNDGEPLIEVEFNPAVKTDFIVPWGTT